MKPLKHPSPTQSATKGLAKVKMEQGMCPSLQNGQRPARICECTDPKLPIALAADASAYGIGAVISHVYPDGSERPISFASRTLTPSEKKLRSTGKRGIVPGVRSQKFHQYLYGRQFTLVTDHKPLTAILGSKKGVPSLAVARLQHWALLLSAYSYEIQFKPTQAHGNADGLS